MGNISFSSNFLFYGISLSWGICWVKALSGSFVQSGTWQPSMKHFVRMLMELAFLSWGICWEVFILCSCVYCIYHNIIVLLQSAQMYILLVGVLFVGIFYVDFWLSLLATLGLDLRIV